MNHPKKKNTNAKKSKQDYLQIIPHQSRKKNNHHIKQTITTLFPCNNSISYYVILAGYLFPRIPFWKKREEMGLLAC
jgi:hypothetical protein